MRNFLSAMLGALAALFIFCAAAVALAVGFIVVISAFGEKKVVVERGSYLVVDLAANFTDAPPLIDFSALTRDRLEVIQLRSATNAIRAAARDPRIKGLLIVGSLMPQGYGSGYAAVRELRQALLAFKASHKPMEAYLTSATTKDYLLASVANDVVLDPYGEILMPGLASESIFFAGAFKKYGVGVQVTRVGKYKSAVEPFIREDLSPENREQLQQLLNEIWGDVLGEISSSRKVSVAQLQQIVDREGLIRADVAKQTGLVDRVAYRDVVIDELKAQTGQAGLNEPFKQVALIDYANQVKPQTAGGRIALLYAEGEIVDGEGSPGDVGGTRFAREIRHLRQDPDVKAIVLRVNSPGGSASAAEEIQRELRLAAKTKPVVVSMGSYAASGGYWISTYSNRIFAEPTTITGSIGVFGVMFDIKELANTHGITFDSVKTGNFADALSISRPKTPAELAVIQSSVDWIYDQFVTKVSESRKLDRKFVEEIAQGRVWSGTEAKKLGLVDELGGLEAALHYAAKVAGLGGHYRVVEFPRKKDLGETIAALIQRVRPSGIRSGVVGELQQRFESELKTLSAFNDPQGIYARLPLEMEIR